MGFDLNSLFENSTFKLIFHEVVCVLGSLYYLAPALIRLREQKENKPFSTAWNSSKNIVAVYVILAEPIFLYEDIKTGLITQVEITVISQILAIILVLASYIILRDPEKKKVTGPVTKHKWSR
ncbi:MAG: hypothetical protein IJP31_08250 [Lachnospiraceae bacterium]|nr:hypothetical protein [Lachnospiraceae bacterium]